MENKEPKPREWWIDSNGETHNFNYEPLGKGSIHVIEYWAFLAQAKEIEILVKNNIKLCDELRRMADLIDPRHLDNEHLELIKQDYFKQIQTLEAELASMKLTKRIKDME